ncbi:MAG TPA: 5'-nucleotidase C-terminal domain-containing protein, partial [Dongiaceae bacterium]|nr:5'-nucleotidase C-terminal domain-containing protein [Dongiaceae bacterium]
NWGDRLASEVSGMDALILGHTHVVIPEVEVGGTLVAQAGKSGEGIGRIDLTLERAAADAPWHVASRRARWIAVTDSVASDTTVRELAAPYVAAAESALARPVGRTNGRIGSPAGRAEDGPAWQLIQLAQLEATGAQLSLAALPDPGVRFGPGDVTMGDLLRLYPFENELVTVRMSGADVTATLEQSARAFQTYTFEDGRPLEDPAFPGYQMDAIEGASYEIDLTRPPGQRILHLSFHGHEVSPGDSFTVAVNRYRLSGAGGFGALARARVVDATGLTVRDALIAYLGRHSPVDASFDRNWTVLPDYAGMPERPLIDRLVREGAMPRSEVMRMFPHEPARRGDLAYALGRAFGWRAKHLSGAFADVPDSLEPWLDGVMKHKVLGPDQTAEYFNPFFVTPLSVALDWCERAAQSAGYVFDRTPSDPSFRRSLTAGVDLVGGKPGVFAYRDTLTRAQVYGLVSNTRYPTIRVLEITDFHGAILGGARERRTGRPIGSSVALAAQLKRLTRENPEGTVLVDGGDWYQGTMISNLAFGRPVVEQMNALGEVAAAIGNHEFDWSVDTLERRVHEFKGAALGANMIQRKNGKRPSWVRADTTVTRRGVRVGILGLCYPLTPTVTLPANVAMLRFDDDSATAVPIVKRLRHAGATVVVGVGHIPGNSDSLRRPTGDIARLARGVPGVDVWYGGHSHNQIVGEVNGVPTMISGAHGEVIGVCDLVTDPVRHRVIEHRFRLETVYADELPPDSAMAANVERWNRDIGPLAAEVVGASAAPVTRSGGENLIGELVSDAMRAGPGIDIAMTNSGGLRADLPAGPITRGGIYEVMPFENTVVTMKLSGAEVRRALEDGLRHGRVTQVSGIRYTFDNAAAPGSRVQALTLADGSALADTRDYVVAVNNFMADGGDEYDTLKNARDKTDTNVTVRDRIMDYVRRRCVGGAVLDVKGDGRITRISR